MVRSCASCLALPFDSLPAACTPCPSSIPTDLAGCQPVPVLDNPTKTLKKKKKKKKKQRPVKTKRPKLRLPRGMRWKTQEARELLLAYVAREHPNTLNTDKMTRDWWSANVTDCTSKLLATCTECRYDASRPIITNIQQSQGFPCFCGSGGVLYASREGYDHVMRLIRADDKHARMDVSKMTREWWSKHVTGYKSKLLATCTECRYEASRPMINDIQQGSGFPCFCNGGVLYASRDGYDHFMQMLRADDKHARMDVSKMTWEWWSKHVTGCTSKLLATCTECHYEASRPVIHSIKRGQGFPCFCRHKTEAFVQRALEEFVPTTVPGCGHHRVRGLRRFVDHVAAPGEVAGATDGRQHFEAGVHCFDHEQSWTGDREKQARLVEDGWRLFRLDQEWVYARMHEPWMPVLIATLARKAIEAPPKTLVLLDAHRATYERHVRHWMGCSNDARVRTYSVDTLKDGVEITVREVAHA